MSAYLLFFGDKKILDQNLNMTLLIVAICTAILKALHCFQEKSPQVKGNAVFSSKVLNWIFKI